MTEHEEGAAALRARALARLGARSPKAPDTSPEEAARTRYELEVHEIELELQVEELCDARGRLEEALGRYNDLYEHAPVGYLTVVADGTIGEANLAAAAMLDATGDHLLGARLGAFLVEPDRTLFNAFLDRAFRDLAGPPCEVRLEGSPEQRRTLRLEASKRSGEKRCRVVLVDVTQAKRDEATRATLESALHEAQKMESIGRLAGGVAHDLNNLLAVVLCGCELLLEDFPSDDLRREEVEAIGNAGQRAAELTSQLLAFSRRQMLAPRIVELNRLVESALKMVTPLLGAQIVTVWRPGSDLPAIEVDPTQLDRVLVNLCVNAREAMPFGGRITLETSTEVIGEGHPARELGASLGPHVTLSVSDSGIGMSPETAKRIFEPFYTTKTGGLGAGLGLSTVYGIVRQSGGAIRVASQLGSGTTFTLYLRAAEESRPSAAPVALPGPLVGVRGHERILLVDDEKDFKTLLRTLLERQGYLVVEAGDARAALAAWERGERFDLLLSDVLMPGMSGPALARKLRLEDPGLKVLFMSGYADAPVVRELIDQGHPILHKPVKVRDILQRIRDLLDSPSGARVAPS